MLLIALSYFALGFIVGTIATISLAFYFEARTLKKLKEETGNTKKQPRYLNRMKRIKDITDEQLELAQQADGPQKNGLDGKYKNNLNRQIKALDEEKNNILISILEDGHDPELTTMDSSGVVTKMKLSEYMAYMGIKMPPKSPPKETQSKIERIGKFTVVKGGKDDGGDTTH
jgi:hypothetical protein